jgi:hypothetical protein
MQKNSDADAILDGKSAAVNHSEFGRCDAIVRSVPLTYPAAGSVPLTYPATGSVPLTYPAASQPLPLQIGNIQESLGLEMTEWNIEKNSDADSLLAGKPATPRSSRPLRNWKHEKFARLVVEGTEPAEAYVLAGFQRHRANHHRLRHRVKDRIDVLRRERETAALAARVPISQVIEELDRRGLARIEDFFERNAAGILSVRNLEKVPVEIALALLKALGEGFGIHEK